MSTVIAAGARITTALLNSMVPQAWQQCTVSGGWGNASGNAPLEARFINANTIHLVGSLVVTTNASAALGTVVVGSLPTGLYPSNGFNGVYSIDGNTSTGYFLNVRSDGSIHCYNLPQLTTSQVVGINCLLANDA